jgi:hypothetical protein
MFTTPSPRVTTALFWQKTVAAISAAFFTRGDHRMSMPSSALTTATMSVRFPSVFD